jgi:hypothetical protein
VGYCIPKKHDYRMGNQKGGKMIEFKLSESGRISDPYVDRRSGEDRRTIYDSDYFAQDGKERRSGIERRKARERRDNCIRVSKWSSVCLDEKP